MVGDGSWSKRTSSSTYWWIESGLGMAGRGSSAASSAGWRPWRVTAVSLARGQGLGLALGDAERSEAAWGAKNRSGATSYDQRGERRHPCSSSARRERKEEEKDGARSIQAREWIRASRTEGEDRRDGRCVESPAHRRSRDGLAYERSNAQEENSNMFEQF